MSDQLMQFYEEVDEYVKVLEDFRRRFPEHINDAIEIAKQEDIDLLDMYRAMISALHHLRVLNNVNDIECDLIDAENFAEFLIHLAATFVYLIDKLKSILQAIVMFKMKQEDLQNKETIRRLDGILKNLRIVRAALLKISENIE